MDKIYKYATKNVPNVHATFIGLKYSKIKLYKSVQIEPNKTELIFDSTHLAFKCRSINIKKNVLFTCVCVCVCVVVSLYYVEYSKVVLRMVHRIVENDSLLLVHC